MLETIRAFATTLLDEPSLAALRARQLAYVLGRVRDAQAARKDDPQAYARLVTEEERDNFRAALAYAAEADCGDELLELAASLAEFWRTSGTLDEGGSWLEESLARAPDGAPRLRGRVLFGLALLSYVRGQPETATQTVERAIELLEEHGRGEELGRAIWLRGAAAHGTRDYATAVTSYERAIELRVEGEVEAVERLARVAEAGLLDPAGEQPILPALELVLDQGGDEIDRRPVAPQLEPIGHTERRSLRSAGSRSGSFTRGLLRCGDR